MDIPFMALRAPQATNIGPARRFGSGLWRLGLLAALSFIVVSSAQAQLVIGGNRSPNVSVDMSVLDRLGPAPNLPQLFGAARAHPESRSAETARSPTENARAASRVNLRQPIAKTASAKKRVATHRVVRHKTAKSRTRVAHARTPAPAAQRVATASRRSAIHLIPPMAQNISATRAPSERTAAPSLIRPASTAFVAPAPTPTPPLPKSDDAPPPPVIAPAPVHEEAPKPAIQPPAAGAPPAPAREDGAPVSLIAAQAPPKAAATEPQSVSQTDSGPVVRPAPVQVASAASIGAALNSIKFTPGNTELPASSQATLDTVATKLMANDALRVQLIAHATGSTDQAMEARRVSLARAVAVRAYLIDKGVRSLRMDVRALGNRSDDGPATDQVDLLIISQ